MTDATAAAAAPAAMEVDAPPTVTPLEAAFATVAATNPDAAKELQTRFEHMVKTNDTLKAQVEQGQKDKQVDKEILTRELTHLQSFLSPETQALYNIDLGQLTHANPAMVTNAAHRLVAACNAEFMSRGAHPSAKRVRVAEPAAAAPAPVAAAPADVATSDLLRRALATQYGM